jgi:sugar phosphate permease
MLKFQKSGGEMAGVTKQKKAGIFYGYWIVVAAFLIFFVNSGASFYSFGLFVTPLEKALGWTRSEIMFGNTLLGIAQGIGGLFAGRFISRFGIKKVIIGGIAIVTICLAGIAACDRLWQFYVLYGLTGFGLSTTFAPPSVLILNWFQKRRGFFIGLAGIGLGFAGVVMPVLLSGLIIPAWGWRAGFLFLGIMSGAIVIPLTLAVVKEKPRDIGLLPYGETADEERKAAAVPPEGLTTKQALRTSAFWFIAISGVAYGFSTQAITLNQVPHLEDIGYPVLQAASALAAVGIGSSIGKFVFGVICDAIGARWARVIGVSFQLIAVGILLTIGPSTSLLVIWTYAILLGLGLGSWVPTQTLQVSTNLGIRDYVTIASFAGIFNTLGGSTGPLFAAYIHDTQGTYQTAFVTFAVMYVIAIVTTVLTRRPKSYRGTGTGQAAH